MAVIPSGYREVRVVVHEAVYKQLDEKRQDAPVRTFQSMLAPLISAFSRDEIQCQQKFVQTGR